MKDFFGQNLAIGDQVAFEAPGYRHLALGIIVSFTPKNVRLEYLNTWNYGSPGRLEEFLTSSQSLIKKQDKTLRVFSLLEGEHDRFTN